jgi:hypothetical protein
MDKGSKRIKIKLTGQTVAILTTLLILTSAIIPMSSSSHLIGSVKAQTSKMPKEQELTINDIRQSRLVLLEGIDNAIQRLIKSEPKAMMQKPRGIFDTTHIAQLLKTDQLEAAIKELNKLQAKVIAVFGPEAANREVVPQIQNLISALKQQEPLTSSTIPTSPPH